MNLMKRLLEFFKQRDGLCFLIGLAAIVAVAAVLRYPTVGFSLPYVDNPDEPSIHLIALGWRGVFDDLSWYYAGYPPGYIGLALVVQLIAEPLGVRGTAHTVEVLRVLSATFNLLTLIFIALTARLAANNEAGWATGAAYAVSPLLVENGIYALPEPLVYLLVSLSLWLAAVAALDDKRVHWSVWSVAVGIVTVFVKYPYINMLLPGMLVLAVYFLRDRQRYWKHLAAAGGLIVASAVPLYLLINQVTTSNASGNRLAEEAASEGLKNLLNPERVFGNFQSALYPLNLAVFAAVVLLGILAYVLAKRLDRLSIRWEVAGLALLLTLSTPWLVATFSQTETMGRIKDVLPATTTAAIFLGIAVGQILLLAPERWRVPADLAMLVALAITVYVPQASASWDLVQQRQGLDRRVEMREWFDINLDNGTVIVTDENHKTFNPFWGGIEGQRWTDWINTDDMMAENSVEAWREDRGASYAVLPTWYVDNLEDTAVGDVYLSQMLRLRTFAGDPTKRGPDMIFYRLWRMSHETDVQFGEAIRLIGYDLSTSSPAPGETVSIRFYWQAQIPPATNYSLFVHLVSDEEVVPITQTDGNPAAPERLTQTWNDPSEVIISPVFDLTIPLDLEPSSYRVLIGLYNFETGERLPILGTNTKSGIDGAYELIAFKIVNQ